MRRIRSMAAALCVGTALVAAPTASAADRDAWTACSKTAGDRAAESAGLNRRLNSDRRLSRVFSDVRASTIYRRPSTSLCADYNGDGRLDRALHYQCCTVSSPAPWLVLKGLPGGRWRIAYKRLSDTTFRLEGDGLHLVTTEPKYNLDTDALCCPSQLRIGTLRWTGSRFSRFFVIRDTEEE